MLNLQEERDASLVHLADKERAVLVCAVAPYRSLRVSPIDIVSASIGLHEEFAIEALIDEITDRRLADRKMMLLLNSPGGGLQSSFKVARALRQTFNDIEIYVPHMAASGGTLIALTGNKIVMGPMSELSPMDPQVLYKGRRISALCLRYAFNRLCKYFGRKLRKEAPYPHQALVDKLDPLLMEVDDSAVKTALRYVVEILELSGYDDDAALEIGTKLIYGFTAVRLKVE